MDIADHDCTLQNTSIEGNSEEPSLWDRGSWKNILHSLTENNDVQDTTGLGPKGVEGTQNSLVCIKGMAQKVLIKTLWYLESTFYYTTDCSGLQMVLWNMEQFNHTITNALQIDFVSVPFDSF